MAQTLMVRGVKTAIFTGNDGYTNIVYHHTVVVSFNQERVILGTGGWRTNTTKLRMNQAAAQFNLGYSVFQKDFDWYVAIQQPGNYAKEVFPFDEGIFAFDRLTGIPL